MTLPGPLRALLIAAAVFAALAGAALLLGIAPPPAARPLVGVAAAAVVTLGAWTLLAERRRRPAFWFLLGGILLALAAANAWWYRGALGRLTYPCEVDGATRCVAGTRFTPEQARFCEQHECNGPLEILLNAGGHVFEVWQADSIPAAKQLLTGTFASLLVLLASAVLSFLRGGLPAAKPARPIEDDNDLKLALTLARTFYLKQMMRLAEARKRIADGLQGAIARAGSAEAALADPLHDPVLSAWRRANALYDLYKLLARFIDNQLLALRGGVVSERAALTRLALDPGAVVASIEAAIAPLLAASDEAPLRELLASYGLPGATVDKELAALRRPEAPLLTAALGGAPEPSGEATPAPATPAPDDPLLESILALRNNRRELEQLRAQVAGPGVIPFVGAGLSIPLGYPGWTNFLRAQGQEAGVLDEIDRDLAAGEYERAAQRLEDAFEPFAFARRVESTFSPRRPIAGPVTLLPKLTRGAVFTTNFDPVLETVFSGAGQPFESSVWGARVGPVADALFRSRRYLIKLHGDANDSGDRVLTAREYDRHYTDGGVLPRVLTSIFSSTTLLFVGCSLAYDRTMRQLAAAAALDQPLPAHFAIIEAPATVEALRERERELARRRIVPIWYPHGEHRSVQVLLELITPLE